MASEEQWMVFFGKNEGERVRLKRDNTNNNITVSFLRMPRQAFVVHCDDTGKKISLCGTEIALPSELDLATTGRERAARILCWFIRSVANNGVFVIDRISDTEKRIHRAAMALGIEYQMAHYTMVDIRDIDRAFSGEISFTEALLRARDWKLSMKRMHLMKNYAKEHKGVMELAVPFVCPKLFERIDAKISETQAELASKKNCT